MNNEAIREFLMRGLREDLGQGDITSDAVFSSNDVLTGQYVCKQAGTIAGLGIVGTLFSLVNTGIVFKGALEDGDAVPEGTQIAEVKGPIKDLMICERLSLNILQRLSGIATRVAEYVKAVEGTGTAILDTRKTTPGLRSLEKYAVRMGGGVNHRMGLYDQVLIKDNHLAYLKAHEAVLDVEGIRKQAGPGVLIEVEVADLAQLKKLLKGETPDIIMLDNMAPALMREAVDMVRAERAEVQLEASGGINLENVRAAAETGVDRISIGEVTHSVIALDIGFYT